MWWTYYLRTADTLIHCAATYGTSAHVCKTACMRIVHRGAHFHRQRFEPAHVLEGPVPLTCLGCLAKEFYDE